MISTLAKIINHNSYADGMGNFSLIDTLMAMGPNGDRPWRANAMTTEAKGLTIDTCDTADNGWETAIGDGHSNWKIVESYPNMRAAEEGHAKWVKEVEGGRTEFPDESANPENWSF